MGLRLRINSASPATNSATYQFITGYRVLFIAINENLGVAESILGSPNGNRTRAPSVTGWYRYHLTMGLYFVGPVGIEPTNVRLKV